MSLSVYEVKHNVLREAVEDALLAAVRSGPGALGTVPGRACAALYALLRAHEIDRRGRCRRCRGGGVVVARRRTCRVFVTARFYLHQPVEVLLRYLAGELHESGLAGDRADDPDATDVLPRLGLDSLDADAQRREPPAESPRRPHPSHGGAGKPPRRPRSRRAPPDDWDVSPVPRRDTPMAMAGAGAG